MPGALQRRVRRTMLDAGGYWRPLAALARLLEELGELSELLAAARPPRDELAAELADLWIITAALGDQYLAELPDPAGVAHHAGVAEEAGGGDELRALAEAIAAAGEIARVVNYYDGPKTPRSLASMPTLAGAVAAFQRRLDLLAARLGIELARAVDAKLGVIHATDMQRFARESSDPSTAPVLERFRAAHAGADADAASLRLWGAPERDAEHALRAFLRACEPERVDAFVVEEQRLGALDTAGLEIERRGSFALLRRRGAGRPGEEAA